MLAEANIAGGTLVVVAANFGPSRGYDGGGSRKLCKAGVVP